MERRLKNSGSSPLPCPSDYRRFARKGPPAARVRRLPLCLLTSRYQSVRYASCSAIAQSVEQMTVNHWVPGSSPGRGAKFKSPDASRGFFAPPTPGRSQGAGSQVFRPGGPHPFGAALKRVRLRRRVQVAEPNSKALTQVGAFSFPPPWTLTRDCVPGYSALRASPLRGRAEARSAAPSSPGRGAKFKSPDASRGFFVSPPPGLSPGTASQVIRPCGPHPFGAALKRVRLRRRVQVAEPNSKALTQVGAFSFPP